MQTEIIPDQVLGSSVGHASVSTRTEMYDPTQLHMPLNENQSMGFQITSRG